MRLSSLLFTATFLLGVSFCSAAAQEPNWNQFRGPNHDNHAFSKNLLKEWPKEGPKLLWKIDTLGAGFSNLAFYDDKIFTLGDFEPECFALAYDLKTGKQLWKTLIDKSSSPGGYVGPRSTPAVDGENVFVFSQNGEFACLDFATGKIKWGGHVINELGGKYMSGWGYAPSPIFDGENVILPIGGNDGTLIAFTKDGERPWRSAELQDPAPYCSAVPAVIQGVPQFVLMSANGVSGIDKTNGKVLWTTPRKSVPAVCSDPIVKDDFIFVSAAYRLGAHAYNIGKEGDQLKAEEAYAEGQWENHHGGIVLVGDFIYFTTNRELFCVELKTGRVAWKDRCVGKGSITFADGNLIVRSEGADGTIALVEANPEKYVEKGRFNQPDRSEKQSWTYPVIVNGKMYIRDQNVLLCYDLEK